MTYRVALRTSFIKDFKKFKGEVKKSVVDALEQIQKNPSCGSQLKNNMEGFQRFRFNSKPQYRIVYTVYNCPSDGNHKDCFYEEECKDEDLTNCEGLIDFVLVKTREEMNNLYSRKKPWFDNLKKGREQKS